MFIYHFEGMNWMNNDEHPFISYFGVHQGYWLLTPDVDHISSHLGAVGSCMLAPRIKFARGPMSYMKDLKELRGAQPNFMGAVSCKF